MCIEKALNYHCWKAASPMAPIEAGSHSSYLGVVGRSQLPSLTKTCTIFDMSRAMQFRTDLESFIPRAAASSALPCLCLVGLRTVECRCRSSGMPAQAPPRVQVLHSKLDELHAQMLQLQIQLDRRASGFKMLRVMRPKQGEFVLCLKGRKTVDRCGQHAGRRLPARFRQLCSCFIRTSAGPGPKNAPN